jgi:predicted DNA-binding transcriptional regulator AlpA
MNTTTTPAPTLVPLLTKSDICRLLQTSPRNLDRLVAGGSFPPADCKIGRGPRWKRETIDDFISGSWSIAQRSTQKWKRQSA